VSAPFSALSLKDLNFSGNTHALKKASPSGFFISIKRLSYMPDRKRYISSPCRATTLSKVGDFAFTAQYLVKFIITARYQ